LNSHHLHSRFSRKTNRFLKNRDIRTFIAQKQIANVSTFTTKYPVQPQFWSQIRSMAFTKANPKTLLLIHIVTYTQYRSWSKFGTTHCYLYTLLFMRISICAREYLRKFKSKVLHTNLTHILQSTRGGVTISANPTSKFHTIHLLHGNLY